MFFKIISIKNLLNYLYLLSWPSLIYFYIGSSTNANDDIPALWITTVKEVWPFVLETCRKYEKNTRVVEHCCRAIRFMIRFLEVHSITFIESLVEQVITHIAEKTSVVFLYQRAYIRIFWYWYSVRYLLFDCITISFFFVMYQIIFRWLIYIIATLIHAFFIWPVFWSMNTVIWIIVDPD